MAKADADVYYYNCGDLGLGQLVAWAHYNNKCVVYSVASEQDCYNDLSHLTSLRDRYMYKYGLKRADHIIVQTKIQKELLGREYGLDSTVIPMPCDWDVDESILSSQRLGHEPKRILWVGRINKEKRLEWLLDLARACPDLIFDVIGDENTPSDYGRGLMAEADSIPNVNMHGRVPRDKMVAFYQSASLLCSTSIYEGFPNVYLEAWSTGLPIVSTFDPDGVIQENGIGKVAEDQQALIVAIRTMLEPEQHQMASNSAKQYFTNHHAIESSMKEFARVFEIANRSRA